MSSTQRFETRILQRTDLDALIGALVRQGYEVIGPRLRDQAIVYDTVNAAADLPVGWTDEQEAGHYRVRRRDDNAVFGYNVGPHAWKRFLFPPQQTVFHVRRDDDGLSIEPAAIDARPRAFLGVRACELNAIRIQDRVFTEGPYVDTAYQKRREASFIIAVNCVEAGNTCFCVSMQSGPKADSGFDLALTEVLEGDDHYFLVEPGSDRGEALMGEVPQRPAADAHVQAAAAAVRNAESQMGRQLDNNGIRDLLMGNLEHPRWDEVADRCLACANCTLVCPTCFCSSVEEVTDLDGRQADRVRHWDSCFNESFSYIAGGSIRSSTASRYRQWLTHKLASWHDQFDTSGCVGCGRCITWCPVGIDITEEARAIREQDLRSQGGRKG